MSPPPTSSPFPTSHDTLGASSLGTPNFLASSPPGTSNPLQRPNGRAENRSPNRAASSNVVRRQQNKPGDLARATSSSDGSDSEVDLSDYTFDLDKLPNQTAGIGSRKGGNSGSGELHGNSEEARGPAGELGGPADFTLNMVDLIRGDTSKDQPRPDDKPAANQKDEERGHTVVADEYSEFEPPLDMSTPAHVMSQHKYSKREDSILKSADRMRAFREGSSRVSPVAEEPDDEDDDIRSELEELRKELRQKDEIIQANEQRVLDAASVVQQVRHLQSELHRQAILLKEKEDCQNENKAQKEQIERLHEQLESKDGQLQKTKSELDDLKCLREEQDPSRKEPNEAQNGQDTRSGSKEDLSFIHSQLEKKDKALEQASTKFQETMTAHEAKLQEKIAEIERLKTQQDEQCIELNRLDSDLDDVMRERDALQSRTEELDETAQQRQQQLRTLNSQLATAKADRNSDLNALRALASELSINAEGLQLPEIISSVKSVCKRSLKSTSSEAGPPVNEKTPQTNETDQNDTRVQLQESKSLTHIVTQQLESLREELEDSKSLYSTAQAEISKLKSQLEEVTSSRSTLQNRLDEVTDERDEVLRTIQGMDAQLQRLQTSKPTSPPNNDPAASKVQASPDGIHRMHRTELDKIQAAHNTALSAIQDSHVEATRNHNALLYTAQQREKQLLSELTSLRKESSEQASELATLKSERDNLESVIEAKNATAATMDTKFANVLKKREEVWEARVERLLGDRERMGKVLMWTWGEMETGDGQKKGIPTSRKSRETGKTEKSQRYRYKHVQKETGGK